MIICSKGNKVSVWFYIPIMNGCSMNRDLCYETKQKKLTIALKNVMSITSGLFVITFNNRLLVLAHVYQTPMLVSYLSWYDVAGNNRDNNEDEADDDEEVSKQLTNIDQLDAILLNSVQSDGDVLQSMRLTLRSFVVFQFPLLKNFNKSHQSKTKQGYK